MSNAVAARQIVRICAIISVLVLAQLACAIGSPQPTATPNRTATAQARAAATLEARLALVKPVLERYKIPSTQGRLAYYASDPLDMYVDEYNTYVYNWIDDKNYSDFIYHTEVAWESTSGFAGCGIIFRSDGDIDAGEFYRFEIMRLQNAPAWQLYYYVNHDWRNLGWKFNNTIVDTLGGTNIITIIAKGANLQAFVNDTKMIELDYNKLSKGLIAELVWQESGKTGCTFSNSWVWALK